MYTCTSITSIHILIQTAFRKLRTFAYILHVYYLYIYIYTSRNEDDRDQFVMLVQGPTVEVIPLASRKEKAMG